MARVDETNPGSWWDRYGHRLELRYTTQPGPVESVARQSMAGAESVALPQSFTGAGSAAPPQSFTGAESVAPAQSLTGAESVAQPQSFTGAESVAWPQSTAGAESAAPPQNEVGGVSVSEPQIRWAGRPQSAADLTDSVIVRRRDERPADGWRRAVLKVSGGLFNPGPSEAELERRSLLHRVRNPLMESHRVAVTSIKGGVGKTTVATCLGLMLAENRGDRAIVLDANPDAGTLADRLTGESSVTVRELLRDIDRIHSWADVSRYTSLAGRLQVLASEQDPASSEAFNRKEYEQILGLLARFYNVVITDSGTGLVHSAMEGTLTLADSVIVVGAPTVDGASRASKTLDWLFAHGHAGLASDAIVVLSCDRTSTDVDGDRIRAHFAARCRAVVEVPHDPHLATGGRVDLARLRRATQDAFLQLAALIADRFDGAPSSPSHLSTPALPPAGH